MRRSIIFVTLFAMLSGCESYNHLTSQRRMDDGIAALQAAETAQRNVIVVTPVEKLDAGVTTLASAESLRVALAEDAQHDIDAVKRGLNGGQPQGQVSALSRAGLKAWQAGAQGEQQAVEAATMGMQACETLRKAGQPTPQRDCETFEIVRRLNALEIEADKLLVYDAYRERGTFVPDSMGTIAKASKEIVKEAQLLAKDIDTKDLTLTANWAERQRAIYLCQAVAGYSALLVIENALDSLTRTANTADAREEARLRHMDAEILKNQLYDDGDIATPLYSALVGFEADFEGTMGTENSSKQVISSAQVWCDSFLPKKPTK